MSKSTIVILLCLLASFQVLGQQLRLFSKNEINEDIDYMINDIERIHPNLYHSINKEDFISRVQIIKNQLPDSISKIEVWIRLNEILALISEGHTYFRPPADDMGDFLKFPFTVKIDNSTKHFVINGSPIDSLKKYIGVRIISINDIPTDSLLYILLKYTGAENESYSIFKTGLHFEYAIYTLFREPEYFNIGFQEGENIINHRFKSIKNIQTKAEPNYTFRIVNDNIGLIDMNRMNSIRDFKKFSKSTFKTINNKNISKLIIDFRGDPGGDSEIGDELMKYLSDMPFTQWEKVFVKVSQVSRELYNYPSEKDTIAERDLSNNLTEPYPPKMRFSGKLILLIDGGTFSSAGSATWCISHYKLGTTVGEETSGLGVHYGNVIKRNLPITGLTYYTSHMKWYQVGANDSSTHGLIPDYEAKLSIEDIKIQKDSVLEYAIKLINSN